MTKRKKTNATILNWILILATMLIFYKLGGPAAVMILFTVLIGAGAIYLSGENFKGIFKKQVSVKSLDELLKMNPYQFESVVAEYFRSAGYVVHQTKRTGDGGKDLIMYKGTDIYYVECKKYAKSNSIQRPLIQKLVGACHPVGAKGIFVTTSKFSKGAITEAYKSNVRLIDGQEFIKLLRSCV